MKRFWRIGLVVAAVLALAGAAVGFVAAQTDGDGGPAAGDRPNFVGGLAENLGIAQEELEAAIRQTGLDLVDEAVAAGRMSEEKAAKIRERIESGEGVPFFQHHRPHRQGGQVVGKVAEFLGLTPQEVVEALKDGQSLAQIAEENGVSSDKLSAFLLGELEARLAEAVENGGISQEQADQALERASEQIDRLINHGGLPKARPHRFGPKGRFDGGFRDGGFARPLPEDAGAVF